jgi:hypothetical protein
MVKTYWLAITLGAGVAIGVFIGRHSVAAPPEADDATNAMTSAQPLSAPARRDGRAMDAGSRAREPSGVAQDGGAASAAAALQFDTMGGSAQPSDPAGATRDSGEARVARLAAEARAAAKVPPGQPFSAVIINADSGTMPESQHDIMMREERDDAWAYMREAEIESSIIAETGAGNFRKDYLECRATLCELQLSGTGPQAAALKKWFEAQNERGRIHPPALGTELVPFSWSLQEDPQRATMNAQIYYRKPEPAELLPRR